MVHTHTLNETYRLMRKLLHVFQSSVDPTYGLLSIKLGYMLNYIGLYIYIYKHKVRLRVKLYRPIYSLYTSSLFVI